MREGYNAINLMGSVSEPPRFDHSVLGEDMYRMIIAAKRLSGTEDLIPVTLPERLLPNGPDEMGEGTALEIDGQVRTYNRRDAFGSHLVITVFARRLSVIDDEERSFLQDRNEAELMGRLVKPPVYRLTPFSREICDMLIAVPRSFGKSDLLPCIAWGRNARFAFELAPGDMLRISGRLQSRSYQKVTENGTDTRTAYEISCNSLEKWA